jgi:hypothetical protein
MPRYIITSSSRSPKHDRLVKKLVQELTAPGTDLEPLILEERVPATQSRHVYVVWDAWRGIAEEERSAIIVEAYTRAEGEDAAAQVTIASGVTPEEARVLGLLPWKVLPIRDGSKSPSEEEYKKAIAAEARRTLFGARARELRYARREDAEAAKERLEKALPGSSWTVIQEVVSEA